MNKIGSETDYTFCDLFAGAGGFSSGFVKAGFRDLCAIEINETHARSYKYNNKSAYIFRRNIRNVHSIDIINKIGKQPTVILASPPCESFTSANKKRQKTPWDRFFKDSMGDLIFEAIRIIGDLEPVYFVIENVVPMINGEGKSIIKDEFEQVGYNNVYFNVIEASQHGCPSRRNRVYMSNLSLKLKRNKPPTVEEAIGDLPEVNELHHVKNHVHLPFPKRVLKRVHKLSEGQSAVYFRGAKTEKTNWMKLPKASVAPTVMGKSRFIHYGKNRPLTVREHARLMGFDDSYFFSGRIDQQYDQVGEAVTPIISRLIAEKIMKKTE